MDEIDYISKLHDLTNDPQIWDDMDDETVDAIASAAPVGRIKLDPYQPSADYAGELKKIRSESEAIKAPEQDLMAQAISSLGPALLGAFTGSAGAMAAAPATEQSQKLYAGQLERDKEGRKLQRENLTQQAKDVLSAQKSDVGAYQAKQKMATKEADLEMASGRLENQARQGDERNRIAAERNKILASTAGTGKELRQAALDERKEKSVDTTWRGETKDITSRIDGYTRLKGLITAIKSGQLVDSANIRNTLTNDLAVLALPSGSVGGVSDREKAAINTLSTKLKEIASYVDSNPRKTIPPEYLKQLDTEADLLGSKYAKSLKMRKEGMKARTNDKTKKDLFESSYSTFAEQYGFNPESGHFGEAAVVQDPQIAKYAEQHGLDYNKASSILVGRGYKPSK